MSTENNTPVELDSDDLDTFSATFFGQKEPEPAATTVEEDEDVDEAEDDATETETQTKDTEDDALAPEEPEEEEPEAAAPKKSKAQERIDELTGKYRSEERKVQELEQRINDLVAKLEKNPAETPAPVKATAPVADPDEPTPTDKLEDGNYKYPLGELDPKYIKDLMVHTYEAKAREDRRVAEEAAAKRQFEEAKNAIESEWADKVSSTRERYPDFNEKGQQLLGTFENIDSAYGEYLSNVIMSMEYGPDVLYYLANNPSEAKTIVDSGPQRATIALGRLEARFSVSDSATPVQKKVTKAPPPPPTNKGATAVKGSVPPDTDDLDAFSREFFLSKKR